MAVLTPAESGQTVEVAQGEQIVVRLPENPTTGYRWGLDQGEDGGLAVAGSKFSAKAGGGIGGGGERAFTLQADRPGEHRLRFKLWRQWEGDASAIQHHDFTVRVR